VATGFGSGYLRPAPGTWGSLAALIVWWALHRAAIHPDFLPDPFRFLLLGALAGPLALLLTVLAIAASTPVAAECGVKDPSFIVADEWAGVWIALAPLALRPDWALLPGGAQVLALGIPFGLFRLFDIWKPWPVHQLQSLPKGYGIVLDDVMAGLYAAIPTFFIDGALLTWLHHRQFP
jgi:phosphatidylglycerophosphatase A